MNRILATITALLLMVGCKSLTGKSDLDDDSASSAIMTGTISGGQVLVASSLASSDDAQLIPEVRKQLTYAIGQLNDANAGTDLSRATITITSRQATGSSLLVTYNASLVVAWANSAGTPPANGFPLLLPANSDDTVFYRTFGAACVEAAAAHQGQENFWYYYRTSPLACQTAMARNPGLVVTEPMLLSPSPLQTSGRMPEYDLIWQSGGLRATFLFGRYFGGETDDPNSDAGIQSFNSMVSYVSSLAGSSGTATPLDVDGVDGNYQVEWQFVVNGKSFDIAVWLVPGDLTQLNRTFVAAYQARAAASSLLVYNGHSGLGANLQQLVDMGWFQAKTYQLMTINACDSYSFDYSSLSQKAASANSGNTHFFDLITNASPADFSAFLKASQAMLTPFINNAQTGQKPLFTDILSGFDSSQHAVVRFEDDNPTAIVTAPPGSPTPTPVSPTPVSPAPVSPAPTGPVGTFPSLPPDPSTPAPVGPAPINPVGTFPPLPPD